MKLPDFLQSKCITAWAFTRYTWLGTGVQVNAPKQKFNRYEIIEGLGIGGMATVYRAYDPMCERDVAVKVLKHELLDEPELRERFERETKIVAKLEHAAIVPVYDVGYENDQLFYIMRHMTGGSLSERISKGGIALDQIAYILLRLADALDFAHRKGIVHRDLKPGNLLFDEIGNAFISDFGIAKFAQAATRITQSGIIGTPRYMSPEQALGNDTDGRSDLYTLGVIFFEILTGKAPFDAATPLALAMKHATEPAPNILDINPNLPQGFGDIFKKVLQKEPGDRYRTCTEFANAFIEALPSDSAPNTKFVTPLPPRTTISPELPTEAPPKPEPAPGSAHQPQPKFRPWMSFGFIVLFLIGFAIWGYPRLTATTDVSTPTPEPVSPPQISTATDLPLTPTDIPPTATATIAPTPILELIPAPPGGAVNIAFTSKREVFVMNVSDKDPVQLTNTDLQKFDLQWLPNSRELLYGEGDCIYKVDAEADNPAPEKIGCFSNDEDFRGVRVSPDGNHIALTVKNRLLILPFDIELLSTVKSAFELQNSEKLCIEYSEVTVKGAQWATNGESVAILYQGPVGSNLNNIGDTVRVLKVDLVRCEAVDPLVIEEFPNRRFTPEGYGSSPFIPSYNWDGNNRFLFNNLVRNISYGNLYLYDMSTKQGTLLNPVDGTCCYHGATFSPDGTHMLFTYQNISDGADSRTWLYYIPLDREDEIIPFDLPIGYFPNPREDILFALQAP